MKKSRFGVERIVGILKDADADARAGKQRRKCGISDQTYDRWRAAFGGMVAGDVVRLKALEDDRGKLKVIVIAQVVRPARLCAIRHRELVGRLQPQAAAQLAREPAPLAFTAQGSAGLRAPDTLRTRGVLTLGSVGPANEGRLPWRGARKRQLTTSTSMHQCRTRGD